MEALSKDEIQGHCAVWFLIKPLELLGGELLKKGEVLERMAGEEVREGSDLCLLRGHGSPSLFIHFAAISWQYFCSRNKLQDLIVLKWSPSSLRLY